MAICVAVHEVYSIVFNFINTFLNHAFKTEDIEEKQKTKHDIIFLGEWKWKSSLPLMYCVDIDKHYI